ncbi:response regulator transcription factor [Hymenobacter sp. ASUV-10]|uniref:Response regulator transcription factor n=1 Tax=Hymenobacter aranciens TaxID=3063996 RepID=A0ABT9B9S2_9BACT|nr:response regulator transcription factor [Hymenobacter sp. ASUV-10]MDO7875016.1 response regulator transcription factor [Hymenobacter sp. ASUV-10]
MENTPYLLKEAAGAKASSVAKRLVASILIVEDNRMQAIVLQDCIESMGLRVIGPVAAATEALQLCEQELPSLAILDVKLNGEADGITLARQIMSLGEVPIVFVSATEDLATMARGWQLKPLGFLPKPYNLTSLRRLVELGVYGQVTTSVQHNSTVSEAEAAAPWLFVREQNLLVRVAIEDIMCVEIAQKYCLLQLKSGHRHSVRTTLAQLLRRLTRAGFAQVHRSWLVQLRHIKSVDPTTGVIRLPDDVEVPLGRIYRDELIERLRLLD